MKSFYDNDFLIELNEKRCTEYASLAQQMTARFPTLYLFYSVLVAASLPILRQLLKTAGMDWSLVICFTFFILTLFASIRYAIPLLVFGEPDGVRLPCFYYGNLKEQLLQRTPDNEMALREVVDDELKNFYKADLEELAFARYRKVERLHSCFEISIYYAIGAFINFTFLFGYYLFHY